MFGSRHPRMASGIFCGRFVLDYRHLELAIGNFFKKSSRSSWQLARLHRIVPIMSNHLRDFAKKRFDSDFDALPEREQRVIKYFSERLHISRNVNREFESELTFGQKLADKVARFGGSWTFIIFFGIILLVWVSLNGFLVSRHGNSFDPYPFILLNLFLSMLASIQAPVILMSQNRQSVKDRFDAAHDYEVNLKAELEILSLHEKIDELREKNWSELIAMQQEQIELLTQLLKQRVAVAG